MIAKSITYFGEHCIVVCDANCKKAWGIEDRPRIYLIGPDQKPYPNEDDYVSLADGELGEAPVDPGTYEGGHAKPTCDDERLNKWCVRACERSIMIEDNKDFELRDFSQRFYNCKPHYRNQEADQ